MPHIPGHIEPQAGQPQAPGTVPAQPVDEFELMRRRLKSRGATASEGQQRQLNRQFAAAGNLPSGAAFKIRQQGLEAADRQTSENLQDVNILQAQTQRAERESAAQRGLQRELGQLAATTQLGTARIGAGAQTETARIGAESAQNVARIRGDFGIREQELAIGAAKENLAAELASRKELTQLDLASKEVLAGMNNEARFRELQISDNTARYLSNMELDQQLTIAEMDNKLKREGLDLQRALTESSISSQESDVQLNTYATWINAIAPLREAGFNVDQIRDLRKSLGIKLDHPTIDRFEEENFARAAEQQARQDEFATGSRIDFKRVPR